MQTERVFLFFGEYGVYFNFCLLTFVKHAQFHISNMSTPQQCTWNFVTYQMSTKKFLIRALRLGTEPLNDIMALKSVGVFFF
jgi:hypothetical protein